MTFGEKLKSYRVAAGMTQEELAAKCGLKKQSISRYEKSDREPNIRIASSLADALGVSLEDLVVRHHFNLDIQFFADNENKSVSEHPYPQVTMIGRAAEKMSPEKRDQMLQLLKIAFPEEFTED